MLKWFKRIAIVLCALLLLVVAVLWWLLGSASGLRFALARAEQATHGALSVQQAQGRLIGPLQLTGVRYADGEGLDAKIASARLDFRVWPLLRKRVHVLDLQVDGVDVALPKPKEEPAGQSGFSLKPPLDFVIDQAHVGSVRIAEAGQPLFASDSLDLAGQWTSKGIELRKLMLRAPDGHADLTGTLAVEAGEQGDGAAGFSWKVAGVEYAGSLEAHGDGKHVKTELKLTQPMATQLTLTVAQGGDYAWTAKLDAPRFDPKPLLGDSSLHALGLDLQGSGDRHGGTLNGQVDLNDYQLLLKPLRAHFSDDFKTLNLEQLSLGSPQIKGTVEASGVVQLGAQPVSGDLQIQWKDLALPASLVGQDLASRGSLKARGSVEAFHAEGDIDVGPPGKLAKLALNLDGTQQLITLHTLELKQAQGGMQAKGTLTLQPALAWQLDATANKLDPGQLFAGWNGALDFDITTAGTLPKDQPDATVEIRKLAGRLRDRQVRGEGKLHLTPQQVIDGRLDLASGGSTVQITAKPGNTNDIDIMLAVASLGDWLPDAQGRLNGDFRLRGKQPKLALTGNLQGQGVVYAGQKIDSLRLVADVPDLSNPGGKLDLETGHANLGGLTFQRIDLRGDGTAARHNLTLQAKGTELSTQLALNGALKGSAWNGTLSTLDLEPQGLPRWRLQQPAQLGYNDGAMNLSELCLTAGEPQLCLAAKQDKAGNLDANYRLRDLPLALLMTLASSSGLPMRAEGTLGGSGQIRRNAAGALSGTASITSPRGTVTYVEHPDRPLLAYNDLALQAELSPSSQRATLRANLNDNGRLDGQIGITGAQQALDGQLELRLNNLAFIELFTNEIANVKGGIDGHFRFGSTLKQPSVAGQANVNGFAAEVPVAGLKLTQGKLVVSTSNAQQFLISGSVQSGKGTLQIGGYAGIGQDARSELTFKGSQFTAADIPAAKVIISPDLQLTQDDKGLNVGGSVTLDSADVDVSKLPGAGATKASSDVVIVDQEQAQEQAKSLPITAQVKVDLGRKTHLVGLGLDGRLSGTLTVTERPGRTTTGQGQITVDGIYKAYGQSLQIEQGRLLFASTPIDNPGLDIRAARKLNPNATIDEGQKVGLYVSGTAQRPVLTVYSNPVMEQSDALSYLITGKPLSQVKGGEGSAVGAAAQALGSAAGDFLAKSIGSKIGLDDVGVSSNEALGGTSAFTVGKFLSPRLYLSYGVGLFEPGQVITLRYRLSNRWHFEAQNATDFSRASLNYRIEK
ncbi:translocation/assembly module TamB domain-containing protein [Dyella koreensis]